MNLANLLVLAAIANQGQSISDKLSNEEAIKLAPEGSPDHVIYNATGLNPLDLLDKLGDLSEKCPDPKSLQDEIENAKAITQSMAETMTKEELAAFALYSVLTAAF